MFENVLQILLITIKDMGSSIRSMTATSGHEESYSSWWFVKNKYRKKVVLHASSELVLSYVYISTAHKIKPLPAGYWLNTCYNGNEATKDKLENKKEHLFHY